MIPIAPKYSYTQGSMTMNIYHADKNMGLPSHTHVYSHLTMCHSGKCIVRKEGKELIITKNSKPVNLVGTEPHEIEALEDGTVFVNVFHNPESNNNT